MKNANKKSKKNIEVEKDFALITVDKRKLLKVIRSTASFTSNGKFGVLDKIRIKLKDDVLMMWATDGNRAIETDFRVSENEGNLKEVEIMVFARLLTGLCFNLSNGDFIRLKIDKDSIGFDDFSNNVYYKINGCEIGNFPDIEKVMSEYDYGENAYRIAFNRNYMEQMKRLLVDERNCIVEAKFNKESNLSPIIFEVKNNSESIAQRTLLMPIRLRD